MRKDIYERMKIMKQEGVKPNYAELARRWNCDYRTVKRYFEEDVVPIRKPPKPSKLDPYKQIIEDKVYLGCTASSIYHFIIKPKPDGSKYEGKYTILRQYVKSIKVEGEQKATIRFETNPGLQAQVDWKEKMKLISKQGKVFEINIFLMLLGYSRTKYIELTIDRNQETLMMAMINGFRYFQGIPKEIIFDNMKTVVDQSRTNYQDAVINETFYQFSKDMGFEVWSCRAFRPQTKGKVEALAKLMSRLQPYNNEFNTLEELEEIVRDVMNDINNDKSFATNIEPLKLLQREKEYLLPLPNQELINNYFTKPITRIVTKESMITYMNNKYSLDPKYIGKIVNLEVSETQLKIIYGKEIVATHKLSQKKFNYHQEHMVSILKSDAMKFKKDEDIENFAKRQLELYDKFR